MNWDKISKFERACAAIGVAAPASVQQGLKLLAVATEQAQPKVSSLLKITSPASIRQHITTMSVERHDGGQTLSNSKGLAPGFEAYQEQLLAEVGEAAVPEVEAMFPDLRPVFETLAAPLVEAAQQHALTAETTTEQLVEQAEDMTAIEAWRATRPALDAIYPYIRWRKNLSEAFDLAPNSADVQVRFYAPAETDYSVCFAAGESWSYDRSYYGRGPHKMEMDWLGIASQGLTLNSPAEVIRKLDARSRFERSNAGMRA